MSVAATEWNPNHTHPQGSWWQYDNDRRYARLTLLGLAAMSVASVVLVLWAVFAA